MKKITLSFDVLAAIIAVTVLQACASTTGTQCVCAKPTLTPPGGTDGTVTICTTTKGAYLRYTLDGTKPTGGSSGHGTLIPAQCGSVDVFGRTLKALAYKTGCADSPIAVGYYTASHKK
jgi:hypothetical protein